MINILIAAGAFKGTYTAQQATALIAKSIEEILPQANITKMPVFDGGEDTLDIIIKVKKGKKIYVDNITTPTHKKIRTYYGVVGDTAYIEVAKACGLLLIPEKQKDPYTATSFGVGQLMQHAIDKGYKKIIVLIGGTGTVDCGVGMLRGLGFKFYSKNQKTTQLDKITRIEGTAQDIQIECWCDGSISIDEMFTPTKDKFKKTEENKEKKAEEVQNRCKRFANFLKVKTDKKFLGAGGGLPLALTHFYNAKCNLGITKMNEVLDLKEKIKKANLIITAEGHFDLNSITAQKTTYGIAELAKNKKVLIIAGYTEKGTKKTLQKEGIDLINLSTYYTDKTESAEVYKKENPQALQKALKEYLKEFKQG